MFRAAAAAVRGLATSNTASASTWTSPMLSRSIFGVVTRHRRQNVATTLTGSMTFASSSTAAAAAATTAARRASVAHGPLFSPFSPPSFRHRSHLDFPRRESVLQRLFGRGGGRGWGDSSGETVLFSLIGLNVGVYALWQVNPSFARRHFVVSAAALSEGRIHTLVTSAFSHKEGMSHLLVNMISLYFFGRSVGGALGGRALLLLYLAAGAGGALAHCAAAAWPCRTLPPNYCRACIQRSPGALGASAAVNGVVALSCLTWPTSTVLLWGILPIPAAMLGAAFVFQDVLGAWRDIDGRYGREGGGGGGVAHAGHLGGAAVGALAWVALRRRLPRW